VNFLIGCGGEQYGSSKIAFPSCLERFLDMKAYILCFALLSAFPALAQTQQKQTETQTKIEIFQARTGVVLIKNYSVIGSITGLGGTITVTAFEFTDAQTGKKEYGIGIEAKESGRLSRENRSYVDYDEISSLIAGIDYTSRVDGKQSKLKNFEAHYKTRGELDVTVFSGQAGIESAVSVGRISSVSVFLQLEGLQKFRQIVVDAKAALDGAK
jgi:hypothetical protein